MHEEVRVAISFRFTGVALEGLENVSKLSKLIKRRTDGVFCSLDCEAEFKEKGMNADAIYQYCLEKFSNCNVVVAFIAHEQGSTGMVKELELAKQENIPVYLIIKKGLEFTAFRESAIQVIEFDNISEIPAIIDELSFAKK